MKSKLLILTTAAAIGCGLANLRAQDAPRPPGDARPGGPGSPGGDPQQRFEESFKRMDANTDGKVSKEEFLEFSKKEAEDRFGKMDAAGSGAIDKAQMMEAFSRMRSPDGGRRPEGFRRPDGGNTPGGPRRPDGDSGGIRPRPDGDNSPPPPPPAGTSGGPPPEGRPGSPGGPGQPGMRPGGPGGGQAGASGGMGELFRKVQETGSVTKEEYSKMSDDGFKRMDTNADGKITKEELEELGRKMREMRGPGSPGGQPPGEGGFRRREGGDQGGAPRPEGDRPKRPESN